MGTLALGLIAALLQTLGYLTYVWKVLRRDIEPNATSWLMFAYGTSLLVLVEWDRDASLPLLLLPATCAFLSIGIAYYCIRKVRRFWWPEHPLERFSFTLDICLTISYILAWVLVDKNLISSAQKDFAEVLILVCWNIGVFTAFFPLLRQVYHHPLTEHATPWILWTTAYGLLAFITYKELGVFNELMLYPLSHFLVHLALAFHTARSRYMHKLNAV